MTLIPMVLLMPKVAFFTSFVRGFKVLEFLASYNV